MLCGLTKFFAIPETDINYLSYTFIFFYLFQLLLKDRDVHRPYRNQNNQNVNNNNGDVKVKEEIKKDVIEESDHSYTSDNEQNGKEV